MKKINFKKGLPASIRSLRRGFTLIELLVVMGIIGLLVTISLFSIQGVRESSRNSRRKADLETIRQAIEFFRADCNQYPETPKLNFGSALTGTDPSGPCASSNTYSSKVPQDPEGPSVTYYYNRTTNFNYILCAALEDEGDTLAAASAGCGSCGATQCSYFVQPR